MAAAEPPLSPLDLAVIGGGPAGLRAAEVAAVAGAGRWRIALFDAKPSVGRKFLVAGRGGLNLTHSEEIERFLLRYDDGRQAGRWRALLQEFSPADLRSWAAQLGVETFVGTSGRVFPHDKQAAGLLRRWVARLRTLGVEFRVNHRWTGLRQTEPDWSLMFQRQTIERSGGEPVEIEARAVVFALGGASWPQTGSDGQWLETFRSIPGVRVAPWQPANCGWEVEPAWSPIFLRAAEGLPLKNIALSVGDRTVSGELLITRYGIEGGALYQLGAALREAGTLPVRLEIDLKPQLSADALSRKLSDAPRFSGDEIARRWRLSPAARALLEFARQDPETTCSAWLRAVKHFPLALRGPRPIAEAISSAGGVAWEELSDDLMLHNRPGVFLSGEMLDWEAPTGGYLLQGCFATGTRAGRGAAEFLSRERSR
jgi:uncharacterized flavoprotein (TIGR03862 family)